MLNTSIVLYKTPISEIKFLIKTLKKSNIISEIFLIDNSPTPTPEYENLGVNYIFARINIGYGAAHNIAIRKSIEQNIPYHLVINPDITFEPEILETIIEFMNNNSTIGHLMPKVDYPNGEIQ